jgi:predicted peroxiredoxin
MRKLIFFAAADPRSNPQPAWSAYHFAGVAARAGLDAEVRLAGDAVRLAQPDGVADSPTGEDLRRKAQDGVHEPFVVSL